MTPEIRILREALLRPGGLRRVAKEVGVSHQTLKNYMERPDSAAERTVELVRRWADRQAAPTPPRPEALPDAIAIIREIRAKLDEMEARLAPFPDEVIDVGIALEILHTAGYDIQLGPLDQFRGLGGIPTEF